MEVRVARARGGGADGTQAILDFNQDLDIGLLDNVVTAMYTGAGADQRMAQQVLAQFQEHPEAWQRVPAVLQQSSKSQTKVRGE